MRIIGIDMDEVIADLHRPWLEWIKAVLDPSRVVSAGFPTWDEPVESYGHRVYDFITPTVYHANIVKPIPGTLEAVRKIRGLGYGIRFVTSCLGGTGPAKHEWLYRHGFIMDDIEFVPLSDKTHAPCDMLVDDHVINCQKFTSGDPLRLAVLITAPHNENERWVGIRARHLSEVASLLEAAKLKEDERMTLEQSNASSYVANAAQALLPYVRQTITRKGEISAADVRASSVWANSSAISNLLLTEYPSVITLAFRLAGLVRTDRRVTNTALNAKHRKVFVWVPAPAAQA